MVIVVPWCYQHTLNSGIIDLLYERGGYFDPEQGILVSWLSKKAHYSLPQAYMLFVFIFVFEYIIFTEINQNLFYSVKLFCYGGFTLMASVAEYFQC